MPSIIAPWEAKAQRRRGYPSDFNRIWLENDVRITTGQVEPHFFGGLSGGPKMVCPGLGGFETIMWLQDAATVADPSLNWGVTEGNPIQDAIRKIADQTGVDFSVNVTINRDHDITSVYAGELSAVHRAACNDARISAMRKVGCLFDIVITTSSRYPVDLNLYQAIKGMLAATQVVRKGGSIICVAECSDGGPDQGGHNEILPAAGSPKELLAMIGSSGHNRHDQWQGQIQLDAKVYLKSDYLTGRQVRTAHLDPIQDVEGTISVLLEEYGQDARICVLPQGPRTIPYMAPERTSGA